MIRRLFICCTPYQIFNSINIVYSNKIEENINNDIIICNHFPNSKKIYAGCRKIGVWKNCYHMKTEYDRGYLETMQIIRKLDFNAMIENSVIPFKWNYDEVYIGTFNNISSIIAYKYCKKNEKKLMIYDEGIATYTISDFSYMFGKKQRLIRKLFDHVIDPKYVNTLFLYHPEWYCGSYKFNIKSIKSIDRNSYELIKKMNYVFDYQMINLQHEQVLFFDQPIIINNSSDVYKEKLQKCDNIFRRNKINYNVIWHPRTDYSFRKDFKCLSYDRKSLGGWELELLNKKSEFGNVYVTPFSTAAILGKMLFNDNDIIIFLYKLFETQNDKIEKFISTIQAKSYKVYVPNDWNEFEALLDNIKKGTFNYE